MTTRHEQVGSSYYCLYCGKYIKEKEDMWPSYDVECYCKKAEEEKQLRIELDKLKEGEYPKELLDLKISLLKREPGRKNFITERSRPL